MHAPGPWTINGKTVKSIHHQRQYAVARVDNQLFTAEANAANARLIAAAPTMLAALQTILNISLMDKGNWARTIEAEAFAAIQRATKE